MGSIYRRQREFFRQAYVTGNHGWPVDGQRIEKLPQVDIETDVVYYNVRENRHQIFERDRYKCAYCGKQLTRFTATLDHIKPVSDGGDNSYDNVTTACLACNSEKTGKPLGGFLADRRGP